MVMNSVNVLDHISVTVSDLDRSLTFYRDLLGLREVERHLLEGETISKMAGKSDVVLQVVRLAAPDTPGILLDLQQYISPEGGVSDATLGDTAHAHFCFGVPDVWAAYRELSAKGVAFVSEPVSFDLDWAILHVVFFKDPDGFVLELVESPIQPKPGHTVPGH
jgi:glyoxylase I family protein